MSRKHVRTAGLVSAAGVVWIGSAFSPTGGRVPAAPCAPENAGIILPAGFCASIFADSLGRARYLTVARNGDVYVALEGTRPQQPGQPAESPTAAFVALRDTNGDGRADVVQRAGTLGNTGIALRSGHLYVDHGERISRYRMNPGQLLPSATPEVMVAGLPLNPGHRARNFVFGPGGAMYVNVGSPSNACQAKDRRLESAGKIHVRNSSFARASGNSTPIRQDRFSRRVHVTQLAPVTARGWR